MSSVLKVIALTVFLQVNLAYAWGKEGHYIACAIAQSLLSESTLKAVQSLLPKHAGGRLANLCSWANEMRLLEPWHWSIPLHFVETPDFLCNYDYHRDCQNFEGYHDMCTVGAINNYTAQLTTHGSSIKPYNLTEAILFLAHFMGDIHQPLHVGFSKDSRAQLINLQWYNEEKTLHHVWDDGILHGLKAQHYSQSNILELIKDIQENITGYWKDDVPNWTFCESGKVTCPDLYAKESIKLACWWAYKGASRGSSLDDKYYHSRLAVVQKRLAQAGVRLASILNKVLF
ncbi:hypothetical protein L7F22_037390 [Adiantum nelumboides]|nr:hypothetical protein [Adiantum nelumboides]